MVHMNKKCYNEELIDQLRREPQHLRQLARTTGINQMGVLRSMRHLEQENVSDYRKEGKNKVYYLKNTEEARQYLYIAEHGRLINLLKKYPLLRNTIRWIQEKK